MKSAVFLGPRSLEVRDVPRPTPGPDEILVKVHFCGVCGSDLHSYTKGLYVSRGQVMGHEFSGTIAEVGANIDWLQTGQRVVIRGLMNCGSCKHCRSGRPHLCQDALTKGIACGLPGGFAEYVLVPRAVLNEVVYLIPDDVSDEAAALVEPLAVGVHAVKQAQLAFGDWVVVFGAGPIGLCTAQVAKSVADCRVIVVDIAPIRLETATKLGFDAVIDGRGGDAVAQIARFTGSGNFGVGAAADVVIECAGVPQTVYQALDTVRAGGTIVSVALFEKNVEIDPTVLVQREITWKGAFAYTYEFENALELIRQGKVNVKKLVTHQFNLEQITAAFEQQLVASEAIKVVVEAK